ncbi:2-hydroxyacid dehydrogenase [Frigidibacter sp. MR17.24]|uniref:2-hydroxyacid dehydrogenase n=1 Tax=Frigidibacter sp. MR17.24 TaxID=3127345 RepID=UPI00301304FB
MTARLMMLDPATPERLDRLRPFLPEGFTIATASGRDPQAQLEAIRQAEFAITGDVPVSAEMFAEGARCGLRAVQKWGVGYDNIDLDAARAAGVRVMRTTGSNAVAVAETALAMMLALNRNIVAGHAGVTGGGWPKGALGATSMMLSGKTVGILGFGFIGQALARLLAGFGCEILYTKRSPLPAAEEARLGARAVTLDALLARADVLSLHCELNAQTRGLIDAAALSRMKPGAILVNLARGGVVVEADLAAAVRSGQLRGAGVDVFATEPVEPGNPLVGLERVITTPHLGAMSADNFAPTVTRMMANLAAVHRGEAPPAGDVLV